MKLKYVLQLLAGLGLTCCAGVLQADPIPASNPSTAQNPAAAQASNAVYYAWRTNSISVFKDTASPSAGADDSVELADIQPHTPVVLSVAACGEGPAVYSAQNLPPGLSLNPQTGIITGTLRKAGQFIFQVSAKDGDAQSETTVNIATTRRVAMTPPMGWNSYDAFGDSVTEKEVLANARYMKEHLLAHGWNYVVIDFRWYDPMATYNDNDLTRDRMGAKLFADQFGRFLPATNRFPSAIGGQGFQPLATKIHALGLKFGIHIMRGIPRQAVKGRDPIANSGFNAADAANTNSICVWCPDMYGVRNNAAGQAWYDSLFRLYAKWGVDFVKVDDLSVPYHGKEIQMIRKAIDQCGRPIVFSTSPGPTRFAEADQIKTEANMWRISGDFWDEWRKLNEQFNLLALWEGVGGPGHWPDADMIPFGHIGIRCWTNARERWTRFTRDEQRTLISLWALAPSPLMLGMNLPDNDEWTLSLLTNDEVIAVDQDPLGTPARRVSQSPETWAKPLANGSLAVGFFNRGQQPLKVDVPWRVLGFSVPPRVRDLWKHKDLSEEKNYTAELPPHGCVLLRATPFSVMPKQD